MAGHGVARHLTQHFFLPAETTLTPHNLLARLLVVAGSPFAGSKLQAAALLLMQSLHSRIHAAVGATWNSEIPLLLQYLQGKVLLGRGRGREGMASQLPSMAKGNPRLVPRACSAAVLFPCPGASTEAGGSGPTAIHSSRRMDGALPVPLDSVLVLVAPPWPCWGGARGEGRTAASGAGAATSFPGPGQLCSSSSSVAWSQARFLSSF